MTSNYLDQSNCFTLVLYSCKKERKKSESTVYQGTCEVTHKSEWWDSTRQEVAKITHNGVKEVVLIQCGSCRRPETHWNAAFHKSGQIKYLCSRGCEVSLHNLGAWEFVFFQFCFPRILTLHRKCLNFLVFTVMLSLQ